MDFERCFGCPGGACEAKRFFDAVERGEIPVAHLVRGRASGAFHNLFIGWVKEEEIRIVCSEVARGIGDGAKILIPKEFVVDEA